MSFKAWQNPKYAINNHVIDDDAKGYQDGDGRINEKFAKPFRAFSPHVTIRISQAKIVGTAITLHVDILVGGI